MTTQVANLCVTCNIAQVELDNQCLDCMFGKVSTSATDKLCAECNTPLRSSEKDNTVCFPCEFGKLFDADLDGIEDVEEDDE